MAEYQKIPQVISSQNLLAILRLWDEFSSLRKQSPPLIVTGILEKEVGLIVNDTIIRTAVVEPPQTSPSYPFKIFVMAGKRAGALRIRLYDEGITIDQLSESPNLDELFKEPKSTIYFTFLNDAVVASTRLLQILWPKREFIFVYGTINPIRSSTFRKCYLSGESETPGNYDEILIHKTLPSNSNPNMISNEFIWGQGNIYAMDNPINEPFTPNIIKIDRSLL